MWPDSQGIGSQAPCPFRHLGGNLRKASALSRREEEHLQTLRLQPYLGQQLLCIGDPPLGTDITLQVMAGTLQSARDEYSVCTFLKSPQQIYDVYLACAGEV
jgi:hypothetical protein